MKYHKLRFYVFVVAFVLFYSGWDHWIFACSSDPEKILYSTDFTKEDSAWNFGKGITVGDKNLLFEPPPHTIQMGPYNGDFFDNAVICTTIVLNESKIDEESAGIMFWFRDFDHNYIFEISPKAGSYFVGRRVGNQLAFPIVQKKSDSIKKGKMEKNEISVRVNGDQATMYINGQEVGRIKGQSWSEGNEAGILGESSSDETTRWQFVNFVVSKPDD